MPIGRRLRTAVRITGRTTARTAAVSLCLALVASLGTALPARAASLPGGKANYVVSAIAGRPGAMVVRLAMYQFRTNGTVVEQYWTWKQNSISGKGNATWAKPSSGYRTAGCLRNCPIRTPYNFQSGKRGWIATGRWSVDGDVLSIRWATATERWRLDTGTPGVAAGTMITSDSQVRGWALGSNAPLSRGVSMRTLYNAQRFYGPMAQNAYGSPNKNTTIGFAWQGYRMCSSGLCMQGTSVTARDKRAWFSSYWATNPAKDGRKVFWNFQTGTVQQLEAPGSACISGGGGHTDALLQALDDSGRIIGVVGVEASLNQRKPGQAVVGAFAMTLPTHQSLVF